MSLPSDSEIDAVLRGHLSEEGRARGERLGALLDRVEQLAEWRSGALPDDLRVLLGETLAARSAEAVELLLSWRRLGGEVTFLAVGARVGAVGAGAPTTGAALEEEQPTERIADGKALVAALPFPSAGAAARSEVARGDDAAGASDAEGTRGGADIDGVPARASEAGPAAGEEVAPTRSTPSGPAVRPSGPPASTTALAGLKAHVEGGGSFRVQAAPADWPERVAEHLRDLQPGRDPDADLAAVLKVVDAVERWRVLPPEAQAALVGLLTARLRAIQENPGFLGDRRIDFAFVSLSAYMKRARPGFVHGLARTHGPIRDSWEADVEALHERLLAMLPRPSVAEPNLNEAVARVASLAKELLDSPEEVRAAVASSLRREVLAALALGIPARNARLVRALLGVGEHLDGPELRTLRRALRDEEQAEAAEAVEDERGAPELPDDWAWWSWTRGKRALIVGGDPREPSRLRLEHAFRFASLEWVGSEFRRNALQGVRERVRAGRTDLVLLLTRFIGHDADQIILPSCREAGVPFVCVQHGYGVLRVRHAVERFLDPAGRR